MPFVAAAQNVGYVLELRAHVTCRLLRSDDQQFGTFAEPFDTHAPRRVVFGTLCDAGVHNVVVAGRDSEAADAWLSVRDAAAALGCSPQTVRNWIRDGRLQAERTSRGTRRDIYQVLERSISAYIAEHGRLSGAQSAENVQASDLINDLVNRIHTLEERQGASTPDQVNLLYTNLRLLEIQEEYDRALEAMLVADEHRRQALNSMRKVASEYRAAIEQFHLPQTPPP